MGDSSFNMLDFGFAYNDRAFSDRVLHIEIIPSDDSDCSNGAIVKTLHISSPILAQKSPFFYKLFKTEMKEAQQREVTLRINSTEELSSLMDVLNFIYNNALGATTSSELLGVLMVADKFEVTCCMKYCIKALLEMPMSQESAVLYLELPSSVLASEVVQPLIDATKEYLVKHYTDFDMTTQQKAMKLPLCAIEVVLGSNGLQVSSEDVVFDFILMWARASYPKLEERREILTKCLVNFICFPNMSCPKLKEALVCPDFDSEQVSKLVTEALFSKVEVPYGHASKDLATSNNSFPKRVYTRRVIKVLQLESPWPRCVVYFNLRKDECADLFPSKTIYSQPFLLGVRLFVLVAYCLWEPPHHFGLLLSRQLGPGTCALDLEFSVMNKSSKAFQSMLKVNNNTSEDNGFIFVQDQKWAMPNLLGMSWTEFMSDDNEYFINDILHLRVELSIPSINNSQV